MATKTMTSSQIIKEIRARIKHIDFFIDKAFEARSGLVAHELSIKRKELDNLLYVITNPDA